MFADRLVEREGLQIERRTPIGQALETLDGIQVVCERQAMTGGDLEDFMLAVAVKRGPLDSDGLAVVFAGLGAPIVDRLVLFVANHQLAALMLDRETDDERAELRDGTRRVDVGLEFSGWMRVHLGYVSINVPRGM